MRTGESVDGKDWTGHAGQGPEGKEALRVAAGKAWFGLVRRGESTARQTWMGQLWTGLDGYGRRGSPGEAGEE